MASINIIDFFKGLWRSKNTGQEEALNHAPISNQDTNDLVSEASNSKNESDELLTPEVPDDTDNEAIDSSLVDSNPEELNNSDKISLICEYDNDSSGNPIFEQHDTRPQISFIYTTKMTLSSDYINDNTLVRDAIHGKVSDDITMVEIEYVASPDVCNTDDYSNHAVNIATIDILGKEMHFINCEGKETSAYLTDAEINDNNVLMFKAGLPDGLLYSLEIVCSENDVLLS